MSTPRVNAPSGRAATAEAMGSTVSGHLGKLIGVAIVVFVVVMVVGRGGGPSAETVADRADMASGNLVANRAAAAGVNAQVLLRGASIAVESLFAERGTLDGALGALPRIDPNVNWLAAGPADAPRDQVVVTVGDDGSYHLATSLPTGGTYVYSRNATGAVARTCRPGCVW